MGKSSRRHYVRLNSEIPKSALDTRKGFCVSEWAAERERKERKDYMAEKENNTELIMYQTEDGTTKLSVRMENDTVWLSQKQMSELFQKNPSTISRHINNVFDEKELERDESNLRFLQIATSTKPIAVYSLDVIISVGYRVKSLRGTQFRKWANSVQLDALLMAMGDPVLTNAGKISKKQAQKKAEAEYSKYQANEVTQVEQDYLETISSLKELSKELSK